MVYPNIYKLTKREDVLNEKGITLCILYKLTPINEWLVNIFRLRKMVKPIYLFIDLSKEMTIKGVLNDDC